MTPDDHLALARVEAARASDGSPLPGAIPADLRELLPRSSADPLVSVLVPCRDDGRYLLDALASLRLCADEHLQVIVADDASTDPFTVDVLHRIADLGITVVAAPGAGPAAARNAALAKAIAPFVLPLDADNLLRPGFIPAALELLAGDPSCAVVHADAWRFGQEQGRWVAATPSVADLLCGNQLDTCAVLRRSAVEAVGGWDDAVVASEDWALWVALLEDGHRFTTLPIIGSDYRMRSNSLRSTLTPEITLGHLTYLVEHHSRLYAEHVTEVVANLAGALAVARRPTDEAAHRRLLDRVAALEAEVREHERFAAIGRRAGANAEAIVRRAEERTAEAEARSIEAEARAAAAAEEADQARHHLEVFQETKLVQWSAAPRRAYARLRSIVVRR